MSHQPRRRFGQNFLHDPQVIARIIAAIDPQATERVVEIGPGQGALTRHLLERLQRLEVIEIDRDLIAPLADELGSVGELIIHQGDALEFDFGAIASRDKLRIVGNLPYNISTPLLFHLLNFAPHISDMHFMLQKEVVQRMAAQPGGGEYGRLSVMMQYRCQVIPLFEVGSGAFNPAPKVDSAVVRLLPHTAPPVEVGDEKLFADLVNSAFAQRRKTLRNSLRQLLNSESIAAAEVDPSWRAEQIDLAGFARLSRQITT